MTVTEIRPIDSRKSKVTLDEEVIFVLYRGEVKRYGLEQGIELSREAYREIVNEVLIKRAMERAFYILRASDKTELELRRKLRDSYVPLEVIDHVIVFLKGHRYLDDEVYGQRYVECHSKRKSRRQIQYDLQQKGLDSGLIEMLLEQQPVDEEAQIRNYIRKKCRDKDSLDREQRGKLMGALRRKGFSYEAVNRVMEEYSREENN